MMDISKLKGHIPDAVIPLLKDVMAKFEINTPLRLAHFLAQCGHESGNFKVTRENLNYSAEGLTKIFPKYFPNIEVAMLFAKQPEKIANKVYANRMGNGDEASGEGFKFRGRGYLQVTGKQNYAALGKELGVDLITNPDLVATTYPFDSAGWFFKKNNLLAICDEGPSDITVTKVTKRVNGGTIGIEQRKKEFQKFYDILKPINPQAV